MAFDKLLLNAILSLDSYNRGYSPGLLGLTDDPGTRIGNLTILADTSANDTRATGAGFYAIAYQDADGQTLISYRGTNADSIGAFLTDASNGCWVGAGVPAGPQAKLAIEFYNSVANFIGADPHSANISLTGHSLGGGLAGFVYGFFQVNGVAQAPGRDIFVDASQFGQASFVASATATTDQIWERAFDGNLWSDWHAINVTSHS